LLLSLHWLRMISYRHYNVIVPKFKVEDLVSGGLMNFYASFAGWEIQEDEYLLALAVENPTEVRKCLETLLRLGLNFNDGRDDSDDFTVVAKEGIWWKVDWLVHSLEGAWFIADVNAPTK